MLDIKIVKTWNSEETGIYVDNKRIALGESFTAVQLGFELEKAGVILFGSYVAPPNLIPVGQMPDELTGIHFGSKGKLNGISDDV